MSGQMVKQRDNCRLCESKHVESAFIMQPTPIGDAYVTQENLSEKQKSYPLTLFLCHQCGHLQLPTVIDPYVLFGQYIYETSTSPGLVKHFNDYADHVLDKIKCPINSFVVEIGSNDGSLLHFFKTRGMRVLGIDPAQKIAEKATKKGLETLPAFFDFTLSTEILKTYGHADIITANNVFAHSDTIRDMTKGIQHLLSPEGVFIFEVSYLVDILDKKLFDTIYHEHLSYHHVSSLEYFLNLYEMTLFDVERIPSKGGSIRCYAKLMSAKHTISPVVKDLMALEKKMQLTDIQTYKKAEKDFQLITNKTIDFIHNIKSQHGKIAGYGASPTVTTLLYQLELNHSIDFLVDDNPIKYFRYSPGCHLAVLPPDSIYTEKPNYIIILAWQYANMIIQKHQKFLSDNGCFIIPLPEFKIVKNGF